MILPGLELRPSVVLPIANRSTDCATAAHNVFIFVFIKFVFNFLYTVYVTSALDELELFWDEMVVTNWRYCPIISLEG